MKLRWPAPERNKAPILDVLRRVLPERGTVLEIASGTGQHIAYFARELPQLRFVPSDINLANLESIRAHRAEAGDNVLEPREIDVRSSDWAVGKVEAILCSNMIHIAPWSCAVGLLEGVGRNLTVPGVFVLYGPFKLGGVHTAPSNEAFDRDLKARDESWGVRDVEAVEELASAQGLTLDECVQMPANNQILVFRR
jgi:SAM-dependent methyltransferase